MGLIPGLPESDTATGNAFLMAVFGYLLLQGANLIADGSELLLEVLDPGIIGGLVLPILGALPDSAIIAMSGLGGTQEEAQEQASTTPPPPWGSKCNTRKHRKRPRAPTRK